MKRADYNPHADPGRIVCPTCDKALYKGCREEDSTYCIERCLAVGYPGEQMKAWYRKQTGESTLIYDREKIYNYVKEHYSNPEENEVTTQSKYTKQQIAELFRNDYVVLGVIFLEDAKNSPTTYYYKFAKDSGAAVDDHVLVEIGNSAYELGKGPVYKVVVVKEIIEADKFDFDRSINYKWAVGRTDQLMKDYRANLAQDVKLQNAYQLLEKRLARAELKKNLDAMLAELPPADADEIKALLK